MNQCIHEEYIPSGEKVDKKHIFKVYNPTFTNMNDRRVCHCGGIFNVNYRRLHLRTRTHEEWETFISIINKTDNIPKIDINHDGVIKYGYFMEDDIIKRKILNKPIGCYSDTFFSNAVNWIYWSFSFDQLVNRLKFCHLIKPLVSY